MYSLKDNFKSLADNEHGVRYLKEDTVSRFLEIPDVLGASPVVFQMLTCLGSFPFLEDGPAVLCLEQLVIVITLMTERYKRVLARGSTDRTKLIFKSLAVYDRKLSERATDAGGDSSAPGGNNPVGASSDEGTRTGVQSHAPGFAVDEAGEDEPDDAAVDDEDDALVLAAFESIDYVGAFRHGNAQTIHGAMIPGDNFRKLIMLLLLIAPLQAQERLSQHSDRTINEELDGLRSVADCVLATFLDVEKSPGIKYGRFRTVIPACCPYLFDGFNALFEHFLFSKNLDLSKHKDKASSLPRPPTVQVQPLLQQTGSILTLNVLSQLSFFLPGTDLFRRLRLLYSGNDDGFSIGAFEAKVFNWRAPTLLLVRGTRVPRTPSRGRAAAFAAALPPHRFPPGSAATGDQGLVFGAYVSAPWRLTHRECFGDSACRLFQLAPVHDVFPASTLNRDYVAFTRPSPAAGGRAGLTLGCPPPHAAASKSLRHDGGVAALGAVSLLLDASFEFGVFTHDYTRRGGAFANSASRRFDFQDRFEVESLEVWGCGGDEEARIQAERWAWEAREAEARRKINLGTGDIAADRALLEMAGLIGQNRSGGSMG